MASIFKKKYPVPMPQGAQIITRRDKRIARWVDGRGRPKTAQLTPDGKRIYSVSDIWYARYRDADGVMRRISTGCRDAQAARKVLADRLAQIEKIKVGIITHEEAKIANHAGTDLAGHVNDYLTHMKAAGRSKSHRNNTLRYLERTFEDCGFSHLSDLIVGPVERWLLQEAQRGRSARSRNAFRVALVSFANWAVRDARLANNPFIRLPVANEAADRRRQRRPFTINELAKLLYVAQRRPLAEYGRKIIRLPKDQRQGRSTWTRAPLTMDTLEEAVEWAKDALSNRPGFISGLENRGQRNAMFYRLAAFTGLRRSELASITLADVHLDTNPPYIELHAENGKNRRGAQLPLKAELTQMLREYLDRRGACTSGASLVDPPSLKSFNLDLAVAGIEKIDSRGRTLDIHSLRHTFGTMLARSGVTPRIAQELMRHSDIRLTTNIYQHLELIDTAGAIEMLPNLQACHSAVPVSSGV